MPYINQNRRKQYETNLIKIIELANNPAESYEDKFPFFEKVCQKLAQTILLHSTSTRAGHLNYCISTLIAKQFKIASLSYNDLNEFIGLVEVIKFNMMNPAWSANLDTVTPIQQVGCCIQTLIKHCEPMGHTQRAGALVCVQQELYRRVAAPYEDTKIEQNGDVFDG